MASRLGAWTRKVTHSTTCGDMAANVERKRRDILRINEEAVAMRNIVQSKWDALTNLISAKLGALDPKAMDAVAKLNGYDVAKYQEMCDNVIDVIHGKLDVWHQIFGEKQVTDAPKTCDERANALPEMFRETRGNLTVLVRDFDNFVDIQTKTLKALEGQLMVWPLSTQSKEECLGLVTPYHESLKRVRGEAREHRDRWRNAIHVLTLFGE